MPEQNIWLLTKDNFFLFIWEFGGSMLEQNIWLSLTWFFTDGTKLKEHFLIAAKSDQSFERQYTNENFFTVWRCFWYGDTTLPS